MPISIDEMKYGRSNLLKLTPPARMAMISVLEAIFEVKKMTEMKRKSGVKRLTKYGIKLM